MSRTLPRDNPNAGPAPARYPKRDEMKPYVPTSKSAFESSPGSGNEKATPAPADAPTPNVSSLSNPILTVTVPLGSLPSIGSFPTKVQRLWDRSSVAKSTTYTCGPRVRCGGYPPPSARTKSVIGWPCHRQATPVTGGCRAGTAAPERHRSLPHGAVCLAKFRGAGKGLHRRGSHSLYLAIVSNKSICTRSNIYQRTLSERGSFNISVVPFFTSSAIFALIESFCKSVRASRSSIFSKVLCADM